MRWLLDTNVVSETIRRRPASKVVLWLGDLSTDDAGISLVTLAELRAGALALPEKRRGELTHWIETVVSPRFDGRVLPLSLRVLIDWIELSRRLSSRRITRNAADLLIAATARVHNLTLVTRNTRDFAGTGVVVYDPWNDRTHRMDED